MRLIRTIIVVVFASAIFGAANPSCTQIAGQEPSPIAAKTESSSHSDHSDDSNDIKDISAYYGFEEIEIIKLDWGIKDLHVADISGDGRNDIAVVNNRKANIELLIQKATPNAEDTVTVVDSGDEDINQLTGPARFEKQSVAVSQKVFSLVCGDLNSDGMVDLAFYGEPKGLYVVLQKASEQQTDRSRTLSWRTRKRIKIDDGLVSSGALVCKDLNGDGADDLVLAGRDGFHIVVQEEDGSLAEPVKYASAAQILHVKVADLDGDDINDLILLTNDPERPLHVRFGQTTGELGPQVRFFIDKPYALELFDVDGLSGDEILTVDAVSGRLTCYEFTAENEQDADWPVLFYPLTLDKENTKRDMELGDFDGDGLTDIAISEPGAAELVFYKQTATAGLAEPVRFPAFADIANLSAADIDGDGKTELAVLSVKEKVLGISGFEDDRLSFPKPVDLGGEPLAMEFADADGSGAIDCVYVSKDANNVRSLRVIYNVGSTLHVEAEGGKGKRVMPGAEFAGETGPGLKLSKLSSNPDGLKVLDVDQDGLKDVLIFIKYEPPILVRQTQKGQFETVDSPKAQASLIKDAKESSVAVADVDGRAGEELLLAQDNFARSLVFADGKSWSVIDQYNAKSTENEIIAVSVFDLVGKGANKMPWILLLDGQKSQLQILKAGNDKTYRLEKEVDVGKWNAAPHLKILFGALTRGAARSILLFDSTKFALVTPPGEELVPQYLEQKFSYETEIRDGAYGNLVAGDINGDGRADVVMIEYKRNHIEVLALDSQVRPIPAMRFKIFEEKSYRHERRPRGTFAVEPRELRIGDVTNDGKDDLVAVIHDRIIIYPQD